MSGQSHRDVIGLTGGIGSGKSTAARLFAELGADVVSADALAREVVTPGSAELATIVEVFGADMLLPDGSLDRRRLGKLVFSDEEARKHLEAILHPAIRRQAEARFQELRKRGAALIVYEVPLLYEAGLERLGFRAIVLIAAPEALCIKRVMERDGLSEEAARARIAAQLPLAEKRCRADIVIENDASIDDLRLKVAAVFERLKAPSFQP